MTIQMKRFLCFFLVAMMVSVSFSAFAEGEAETPEYDFKTFRWGASKEDIIAVEGEPTTTDLYGEVLVYDVTAVGMEMKLFYSFDDRGLVGVSYLLTGSFEDNDQYIEKYNTFKAALSRKYGEPTLDEESWESDEGKAAYADKKGDAVFWGQLSYVTFFSPMRSRIVMYLSAPWEHIIYMTVTYYPVCEIVPDAYAGDI